jgi:hypothetical protein
MTKDTDLVYDGFVICSVSAMRHHVLDTVHTSSKDL